VFREPLDMDVFTPCEPDCQHEDYEGADDAAHESRARPQNGQAIPAAGITSAANTHHQLMESDTKDLSRSASEPSPTESMVNSPGHANLMREMGN
jgi:hypothetical protein